MGLWKKVFTAALPAVAIVFCLLSDCYPAANYKRPKTITVVTDDNYPPYIFRDSKGSLQGVIVDQWNLWEKKTGIRVRLIGMDWEKALQSMAEGKADVIDTAFVTEQRAKQYDFSKPYATIPVPIFFHKDIGGISGVDSLSGFTVGVKKGDACIDFLRSHGITAFKEFASYEEIIKAAAAEKIRVFCMDEPPALYYLNEMNIENEYRGSAPLYSGQLHRAVLKGRRNLFDIIEDGFSKISSQEYARIDKKWMGSLLRTSSDAHALFFVFIGGRGFSGFNSSTLDLQPSKERVY